MTSEKVMFHEIINPWNGLVWEGPSHPKPCQGHHGASIAAAHPACKASRIFNDLPEFGSLDTKDTFQTV